MKKHIFFLTAFTAVAGLMTSCSNDGDMLLDSALPSFSDSNSIVFSTENGTHSTRSGVTITSLDKFTADAVTPDKSNYFSSVDFTFNASKNIFESDVPYYWPTDGTLNFYAISDPGTKSVNGDAVPSYTYNNWAAEKDLVGSTVMSGEKEIPYPLTFKHLTSQVSVSAEAENKTESLTYKLTSVTMETPCNGTYKFDVTTGGFGSWDIDNASSKTYSYADALPRSFRQNGQIELTSTYWNILPLKTGTIKFKVGYEVYQNGKIIANYSGDKAKECIVENPNLLPGKCYIYNFILTRGTDDTITFTATVDDWDDTMIVSNLDVRQFVKVNVNPCGNASFSCGYPLNFADVDGVKAYMITGETASSLVLEEISKVPANTGIILFGDAGEHSIPVLEGVADDASANLLKATTSPFTVTTNNIWALSKSDGQLHPVSIGATIGVGKAYLISEHTPEDIPDMNSTH